MARSRDDLQVKLEDILQTEDVWFQPPSGFELNYPCIIYERSDVETNRADNTIYSEYDRYVVTVVDSDPDSKIYKRIMDTFMHCSYDRRFKSDNLYHDVLTLYW